MKFVMSGIPSNAQIQSALIHVPQDRNSAPNADLRGIFKNLKSDRISLI
jgi:hypothetical protein